MTARGGGSIVNIASVHARTTSTNNTPYVATKGAVVSLTRAMALEGAPHQIRVNCVSPGAILTPMLMENWGDLPADQHPLVPRIPLGRVGQPDEIARVVQFLASDDSSYMTGSEVLVDGGMSAHFD
jgi:NAD(P)-dependent dehydrogenase (short-subunit alcohol dehydrogenase family)